MAALEGPNLLREALSSGLTPAAVFVRAGEEADLLSGFGDLPGSELLALPPPLFAALTDTEAPQGIAALFAPPLPPAMELPENPLLLVLAGVQDPGNVGTLLRSAEAFGATGALFLPGTATPWSGKALRASAGSAFRLPFYSEPGPDAAQAWLRRRRIRSFAAIPTGGQSPEELSLTEGAAIWIGSEGAGLAPDELAACDARISLPMPGPVESLNAAVAGSLLLYEAARQRATHGGRKEQRAVVSLSR